MNQWAAHCAEAMIYISNIYTTLSFMDKEISTQKSKDFTQGHK